MVDVEDLVTTKELAKRLGVVPSAVVNWRNRHPNFPKPYGARGGKGGVYVLSEVEVWLAKRGEPIPPTPIGNRLDAYAVKYLPNGLTPAHRKGLL